MRQSAAVAAAFFATASLAPSTGLASSSPSTGLSTPASAADLREFRDTDEPRIGSTDIRKVVVDNGDSWVKVRVKEAGFRHSETNLWIDSAKADPGPEYLISGYQNSEFFGGRVEGFDDETKPTWHCDGLRMRDDGSSRWVVFTFKSTCTRGHGAIRVHADSKGNAGRDHAPNNSPSGDKRFYDWVPRGTALTTSVEPRPCDQAY